MRKVLLKYLTVLNEDKMCRALLANLVNHSKSPIWKNRECWFSQRRQPETVWQSVVSWIVYCTVYIYYQWGVYICAVLCHTVL